MQRSLKKRKKEKKKVDLWVIKSIDWFSDTGTDEYCHVPILRTISFHPTFYWVLKLKGIQSGNIFFFCASVTPITKKSCSVTSTSGLYGNKNKLIIVSICPTVRQTVGYYIIASNLFMMWSIKHKTVLYCVWWRLERHQSVACVCQVTSFLLPFFSLYS